MISPFTPSSSVNGQLSADVMCTLPLSTPGARSASSYRIDFLGTEQSRDLLRGNRV